MEQAVFTDISPVKATNISANPQWPKIRVLTLTPAPEEHNVYSPYNTNACALQRSAMCFGRFVYMPLLTERDRD
jgi:hypothetical protein